MRDPGAPLTAVRTVSPGAVNDGPAAGPAGRYTLLAAGDIAGAGKLVEGHPFVSRGASLQVSEVADLGGF